MRFFAEFTLSKTNVLRMTGMVIWVAAVLAGAAVEARAVPVDAVDISGRAYEKAVLKEIEGAKESIYVAMYAMYTRLGEKDNPVSGLIDALIGASERGVSVEVYLDKSPVTGKDMKRLNKGNDDAYKMFKDAGLDVYFVQSAVKMHEKLIVIDDETVIDGSTNWTSNALFENYESAEIFKGREFAEIKLGLFQELEKTVVVSEPAKKELLEKVRVSNILLEDKRFAPRMVTDGDGYTFDLYLLLLKCYKEKRSPVIEIDYRKTAEALGIKVETKDSKYRQEVRRLTANLKDKYGLLDYTIDKKGGLAVKLLDYEERKDYSTPESGYFNVPLAYWEYGMDKQLMLREKFAYLAAIYEQEIARPKLWWQKSLTGLSEKYHIDESTFDYGLRGLKKKDLIEVRHSRVKQPGSDQSYKDREPNEYRLKNPLSPQEKQKQWKDLEKRFGVMKTVEARKVAVMIDEGDSIESVEDFIRLFDLYGEDNVKMATATVSRLGADNPLRNISYIVGVLKRMKREGLE